MENTKAFTLIEMLVTLVITGVLITSASTWLHRIIVEKRLEAAANRIFADMRLAQSEAFKHNETVFLSFNISGNNWCYGMSSKTSCDCSKVNHCQLDGVNTVVSNRNFKGIYLQKARFAGGTEYTAFNPEKGFALAKGMKNGTVWLKSSNNDQLAVILNRVGRVRFCSPTLSKYTKQCPKVPAI